MTKILERLEKNLLLFKDNNEEENIFWKLYFLFSSRNISSKYIDTKFYIILKGVDSLSPNILERFNDFLIILQNLFSMKIYMIHLLKKIKK